jgi:hypothetical protein
MPFTDSDLRTLQPQSKKYRASAGDSLFVEVYPNGGRYFVWRHRFPPGKEGKLRDYQIGPYGKGPGQWTLKEARDERARLDVLRRQGEDPRALKAEQRQTIQRTGAVTFQKAADEWLSDTELAATTLKDYKNKLQNQILYLASDQSSRLLVASAWVSSEPSKQEGQRTSPTRCLGCSGRCSPMPSIRNGCLTPTLPEVPDTPTQGTSPRVTPPWIGTMCLGSWRISPATRVMAI